MHAIFSRRFSKEYDRSPRKIRDAFDRRLRLFLEDPFHPLLNNHALTGVYRGCRSINVTGDWRGVFQDVGENTILFIAFGTHSQLYKK